MAIDPSNFYLHNISDTCAVWNVLSSRILYSRADQSGVVFYCTEFVIYECLNKKRTSPTVCSLQLQKNFQQLQQNCKFRKVSLSVEDLHDVDKLNSRKRLGKGELSTLAYAMKTRQAFLSDDQNARKFAENFLGSGRTQTTPHLFSWLIFTGKISDSEKAQVISEHLANEGDISPHLENAYLEACRCRCCITCKNP
jgi:hypothetical protein